MHAEQFEKDVWSSNGGKIGNGCSGITIFNEEEGNYSDPVPKKIKDYTVINIDFKCVLDKSKGETSFGNEYRQKTCTLTINVKG